jgi:hypothetical protein
VNRALIPDLNEAILDVYGLRDGERWIALENSLPWKPGQSPHWLTAAPRKRRIDSSMFDRIKDKKKH